LITSSHVLFNLLHTSIIVGSLYTLTGPNLAAIATLSGVDVDTQEHDGNDLDDSQKNRRRRTKTFLLGIGWGVGSSIGIMFIVGILMVIQGDDTDTTQEWMLMDDWLWVMMQAFVGVFLLILGAYGLVKALKNREHNLDTTAADLDFGKSCVEIGSIGSAGQESEITEIVVNRMLGDIEDLSLDSSCSGRQQASTPIRRHQSNSDESTLVEQMETCLTQDNDQGNRTDQNIGETLGLSEFELRMWKAAKSLTDK
jgi:hypothetical protein